MAHSADTFFAPRHRVRIIAAVPACGLLAGCAAGVIWPVASPELLFLLLLAALGLASLAVVAGRARLLAVAVVVGASAAGMALSAAAWERVWRSPVRLTYESIARDARAERLAAGITVPEDDRAPVVLTGRLEEDAAPTAGGGVNLRVRVQWMGRASVGARDPAANPVDGSVVLTVGGELGAERMHEWRRGRAVRVAAQLRRPTRYLDPGVFDQERALARRGVTLVGSVKSAALVEVTAHGGVFSETAAGLRAFTRDAVQAAVGRWSQTAAGIVTAILIGDRTGLTPDVERSLQEAGTYHVIAISGGNVAILAGLTVALFRAAGMLGRGAMLVSIVALLAYGAVVSGGASVDRATWMAVVYFAGRAIDLRGPPLNTLALIAGALVAANPLAIADPGFLLTFGASAGLLFTAQLPLLRGRSPLVQAALALGIASLAAEIALLPVSATFFSRITFAGLALNFIAIPMMAVAQIAGMVVVPVYALSASVATIPGALAAVGAEALVRSAALVRFAPIVTWRVAAPNVAVVAAYYTAMVCAWWLYRQRGRGVVLMPPLVVVRARRAALAVAAAAAVWMLFEPWTWWLVRGSGRLEVTFLDVGQGDSALIRFPTGEWMLVDAGGTPQGAAFDIGDRIVGQAMRSLGVRRLDALFLTHGDADHVGGAASIVRDFHPHEVWEGVPVPPSAILRQLRAHAVEHGVRWVRAQTHDQFFVGDVDVRVLRPPLPDWERQAVRNDDSIVLELRWRDVSVLLTGDIGINVERTLVEALEPARHRVLKVAHHGSLTSTSEAFLRVAKPDIAVVSVGRSNTFGHPTPAVLERLESIGATVYRTDRHGAVSIISDGTNVFAETFNDRAHHEVSKTTK